MTVLNAIILGLVQGIAEFLPISSSGHLAILQNLLGMSDVEGGHLFFDVLLHLGTLIAICFVFWSDIVSMVTEVIDVFRGERKIKDEQGRYRHFPSARLFLMICIATLPLLIDLAVNDYLDALTGQTAFVGIMLILTGCVLFAADRMKQGRKNEKSMTVTDALLIGLCQCAAAIPGLSRSGVTITAGIATGQNRSFAVKFSILLSIPAVLGAVFLEFIKAIKTGIDIALVPAYIVGMIAAMVSGVLAINILRLVVSKGKFGSFAYYCWVIGALTIVLSMIF